MSNQIAPRVELPIEKLQNYKKQKSPLELNSVETAPLTSLAKEYSSMSGLILILNTLKANSK
jgi:hypothetical protein